MPACALALALAVLATPTYRYTAAVLGPDLEIVAELPPSPGRGVIAGAPVEALTALDDAGRGRSVAPADVDLERGARLRYRFALGEDASPEPGGVRRTRLGRWLLRPAPAPAGARFTLEVRAPPGTRFVSGWPEGGAAARGLVAHLGAGPDAFVGPLSTATVAAPGGKIAVAWPTGALDPARLRPWVTREARAVAQFYGAFPVPRALVIALPRPGGGVPFGAARGMGGASVRMYVGQRADAADLRGDWKLRHELVHLGLPNLGRDRLWLEEGLATYGERIIAARTGRMSPAALRADLAANFTRGRPRGQGLDGTRRWGEVYWGGALFWCVVDAELRAAGQGGLRSLLGQIRRGGGSIEVAWSIPTLLRALEPEARAIFARNYERFGVEGRAPPGPLTDLCPPAPAATTPSPR